MSTQDVDDNHNADGNDEVKGINNSIMILVAGTGCAFLKIVLINLHDFGYPRHLHFSWPQQTLCHN